MADIIINDINPINLSADVLDPSFSLGVSISVDPIDLSLTALGTDVDISYLGHIGAFYFGPVTQIVTPTEPIQLSATILAPTVKPGVSITVTPNPILVDILTLQPRVYGFKLIDIDFSGVPRIGSSPLIVDFTATVRGKEFEEKKYKVTEYRWYFDYGRDETTYEITTVPTVTHSFSGYAGKTFDVRLCVVIDTL